MRNRKLLICLFIICCWLGSKPASAGSVEAELMAIDQKFAADFQKQGGAAWAKNLAENAASEDSGVGRDAIVAFYSKIYATPGFKLTWVVEKADSFGGAGVTSGSFEFTSTTGAKPWHDHYITLWRKLPEGWRIVWDGSADPAPPKH